MPIRIIQVDDKTVQLRLELGEEEHFFINGTSFNGPGVYFTDVKLESMEEFNENQPPIT